MKNPLSATQIKIEYYFHTLFKKHIKKSLYAKFSFGLLAASVSSIAINPIAEIILSVVDKNKEPASCSISLISLNTAAFITFLFLSIVFFSLAKIEQRKIRPEQINSTKKIVGHWRLGNANIHCYNGDITEISEADIVITSEDTGLELGSLTGTSVSGRIRKLAATRHKTQEIKKDNLFDFVADWKKQSGKMSNFELGTCISCPPFEAASNNIKKIITAVAIQKNQDKTTTIETRALVKIIKFAFETAQKENYRSIFIPVFALGSGNLDPEETISSTINSIKSAYGSSSIELDIYIGTYRDSDLVELITQLQNTLHASN
ncbi:hypothetical protein [Pseudomonas donghuensis]|uniref:hypothetical protein n=1 Tax=Pseudomonas donghuensis TaxID=1163398 RepID=UPI00215F0230|nr:hypothetical protein [Pseudomonas donghuensis]UVL23585.1 hypothetical protein LOY30_22590 [Pseudomonas donghuensis]